jgi:type II secretory pathway component PulM
MSSYILLRIEALQKELQELRRVVLTLENQPKQTTQLRGIWKDVTFSEDDLTAARQSTFKGAYDL